MAAGYIYLMYADTGHYKIGMSVRPNDRLRSFRTEMPVEVYTIYTFPTDDMRMTEWILHQVFSEKRYKGEWFDLDEDDVAWIFTIYKYNAELQEFEYHATLSEEDDAKRIVQLLEHAARTNSRFTDAEGNPSMGEQELGMLFHLSLLKEQYGEIDVKFTDSEIHSPHIALNFLRFRTALADAIRDDLLEQESFLSGKISIGFNRL